MINRKAKDNLSSNFQWASNACFEHHREFRAVVRIRRTSEFHLNILESVKSFIQHAAKLLSLTQNACTYKYYSLININTCRSVYSSLKMSWWCGCHEFGVVEERALKQDLLNSLSFSYRTLVFTINNKYGLMNLFYICFNFVVFQCHMY